MQLAATERPVPTAPSLPVQVKVHTTGGLFGADETTTFTGDGRVSRVDVNHGTSMAGMADAQAAADIIQLAQRMVDERPMVTTTNVAGAVDGGRTTLHASVGGQSHQVSFTGLEDPIPELVFDLSEAVSRALPEWA